MRSDMRALLKIIGSSFLLVAVVAAILMAAALDVLSHEVAVYLALAVLVVGGLVIRLLFGRALVEPDRSRDEVAQPDTQESRD
jgi:hypothetical protein